jgi:hypothetical protein
MNRAQAELKAFEKQHGIAALNRGDVADHVLTQWESKKQAYGDAGRAADTKQKQVWGTADRRGGLNQQDVASLRSIGRAGDVESTVSGAGALRTDATSNINRPDRSADFQARSEDNARRQNRQQTQTSRDESRRRQDRSGQIRQSTRDLRGAGSTEQDRQDRRFNERVVGYGQARGQRGGQGSRGMQERSGKGRRYGKLSGGGQRPEGRTPTLRDSFIEKYGNRPSQMATYESANDPRYGNAPTKEEQRWIDKGNIIRKDRNPRGWTPTHRGQNGGGRGDWWKQPRKGEMADPRLVEDVTSHATNEINKQNEARGGKTFRHESSGPVSKEQLDKFAAHMTEQMNKANRSEPRKAATSEEGRIALLTGEGGGSGSVGTTSNEADRIALLTGSGSSTSDDARRALLTGSVDDDSRRALLTGAADDKQSSSDRMKLLTGEADPVSETRSVYGGREEYDPQDRAFNQQFSEAPRGPQPWDSPTSPASSAPSTRENLLTGQSGTPSSSTPVGSSSTSSWEDRIAKLEGKISGIGTGGGGGGWQEDRIAKLEGRGSGWDEDRITQLEGRSSWDEDRIAKLEGRQPQDLSGIQGRLDKLESRKPIINNATVDLSGVQGRLDKLEGRSGWDEGRIADLEGRSGWDEDRIAKLEGRKPQDLSGIQGRLTDVEGRTDDTSWKDRLSKLENYYKNDPPPEESTGNRYEDKLANLNKMWERTGKAQSWGDDALAETGYKGKDAWDYSYANDQGQAWAKDLPTGYVEGIRALNREYNKPVHEAIIKGREYKAYDPRAAARLRLLDQENIHEDTYLGKGNWDDAYGERVSGKGKGDYDRYFASQSGLEKDSDEYKERFTDRWGNMGKDYAWYQ